VPVAREIRLGSINGRHGVKGWVKVYSYTDPLENIFEYSPLILRKDGLEKHITILNGKISGKRLIAQIEGVETWEHAEKLIGYDVYAERESMPKLEQGQFYWFQLEGLLVENQDAVILGKIDHMLETGANDVMALKPIDISVDNEERLIPYSTSVIVKEVDLIKGKIVVDWEVDY
jgi:16S rRNA processing protein RimM